MKKNKIILILICIIFLFLFESCNNSYINKNNSEYFVEKNTFSLGTLCSIKIYDKRNKDLIEKLIYDSFQILDDITENMSTSIETSEVYKINNLNVYEKFKVSYDLKKVLDKSFEIAKISNDALNISIGAIVDLWKIGTEYAHIPNKEEIQKALESVGMQNFIYDGIYIEKINKDTKIDLGAIAKGYAADKVKDFLKKNKVNSAIINLGGNVELIGEKPNGDTFKVGIQDPRSERNISLGILSVKDKTVVTSGDYERFFIKNGKRYHHIFAENGYPVENDIMAVAVLADNSMLADGLSTALFVMGKEKGMKFIKQFENVECMYITKNKKLYPTIGFENVFTLKNKDYEIIQSYK